MSKEESKDVLKSGNEPDEILIVESPVDAEEISISETNISEIGETGDLLKQPEQVTKESDAKSSPRSISESSVMGTSPVEGIAAQRRSSSSSDSAVMELNKAALSLEQYHLDSGKLVVFQKYFEQPKMKFFVKPEGRRRHKAGDPIKDADLPDPTEVNLPEGENESDGSYAMSSAKISMKVSSDECSAPSDPRPDSVHVTQILSDTQQAKMQLQQRSGDISQPMDIPARSSGSNVRFSGSYPSNFPKSVSQQISLEYDLPLSTRFNQTVLVRRKISLDSSYDYPLPTLSSESSVGLDMHMISKPGTTSDDKIVAKSIEGSSSAKSSSPILITDLAAAGPSGCTEDLSLGFSEMMLTTSPSVHGSSTLASPSRAETADLRCSKTSANRDAEAPEG